MSTRIPSAMLEGGGSLATRGVPTTMSRPRAVWCRHGRSELAGALRPACAAATTIRTLRRSRRPGGGRRGRRELGPSGHGALRAPDRDVPSVEEGASRADVGTDVGCPRSIYECEDGPCGGSGTGCSPAADPGLGQGSDAGDHAGRCVDGHSEESLGVCSAGEERASAREQTAASAWRRAAMHAGPR